MITHKTIPLGPEYFIIHESFFNKKLYIFKEMHMYPALNCQGVLLECGKIERQSQTHVFHECVLRVFSVLC
jgi:hypothetical protein